MSRPFVEQSRILPPHCEMKPPAPVGPEYKPVDAVEYPVRDGDDWARVAAGLMDAQSLIEFNFQTSNPAHVNWYLHNYVGCTRVSHDGCNFSFSSTDKRSTWTPRPGIVYVPGPPSGKMNTSISHNVPIIIQPQTWSCWYTSLQMVVQFYRGKGRGAGLKDPSEVPEIQKLYTDNVGVGKTATEREEVANKLGFSALYQSLTNEGMWELLKNGPLIYAGRWPGVLSGHWVVIAGISGNVLGINNPAEGRQTWDFNFFMSKYLLQTAERPLIYVL
jgi:hypothetical protein